MLHALIIMMFDNTGKLFYPALQSMNSSLKYAKQGDTREGGISHPPR